MNILLINQFPYYATGTEGTVYPPLGLAYMASVLEKSGYKSVRVLDANILRLRNEEVIKKIAEYATDIIGVSANVVTQRVAIELCEIVRKRFPKKLLVVGGPLPILHPEKFLKDVDSGVETGFFDGTAFFEDDITIGEEVVAFNKKAFKSFYFRPLKVADILFSIHSFSELKWIINQVVSVLFNLFGRKLLRAQG